MPRIWVTVAGCVRELWHHHHNYVWHISHLEGVELSNVCLLQVGHKVRCHVARDTQQRHVDDKAAGENAAAGTTAGLQALKVANLGL